jgi:hypothetical protein
MKTKIGVVQRSGMSSFRFFFPAADFGGAEASTFGIA